jgi:hypothetical protein
MKMVQRIGWMIMVLGAFFFEASAGHIEKGFEALSIYNYFEAKSRFTKAFKKDSSASSFGMATIYFRKDNPFHSLDSAYKFVNLSERTFFLVSDKKKEALLVFGFEYLSIIQLRAQVSYEYYRIALEKNSIEGFDDFILKNDWANERFQAIYKRDSLAFEVAVLKNTALGYETFLQKYPESDFLKNAQKEYELRLYIEKTRSGKINDYVSFCKQFPRNRHTVDAEDRIYELSVARNRFEDYIGFVTTHPYNRNSETAWRRAYQLFLIDYSDDRIAEFQKKYPNYPFKEELDVDLKFSQRNLVPQKKGSFFGFMDFEGHTVISPTYENLSFYRDGLALAVKNGKAGYIDKGNKVVIDFKYDSGSDFEEGRAIVRVGEKFGVIDRSGRLVLPLEFEELGTFSKGLIYGKKDSLYAYYDNAGVQRIEEKFDEAFSFSNGLAKVQIGEYEAFIDVNGSVVVPPLYTSIQFFNDSLLIFEQDERYGIMNRNGQIVDSAKYDRIGNLSSDRAIVIKREMLGYMNGAGKIVLEPKFEEFPNCFEIGRFNGTHAVVRWKGKYGVIDKLGKMVIPANYLQLHTFSPLTAFNKGKGWGYIDLTNSPVIAPLFDNAESLKEGYALVEKAGLFGMIDTKGNLSVPFAFTQIERLDKERIIVSFKGKYGVLNLNGLEVVPVEYEQVRSFNKDFLILTKGEVVHYLHLSDNKIIKPSEEE